MGQHRSAISAAAAALLVVLLVGAGGAWAATTVVDRYGRVLTVDVATNPYNPSVQGLRVWSQEPGGETTSEVLSATYDTTADVGPQMAIDPDSGDPVVVWSRWDGADFELAITRRLPDGAWGPVDLVTASPTGDVNPRFQVDAAGAAHVLWWPEGAGGPVQLQAFDIVTGAPRGEAQRPLEYTQPWTGRLLNNTEGAEAGGGDDPGTVGGNTSKSKASAYPCTANPAAAPDHGVLMSCGRVAAYQLSGCYLVVGVYDPIGLRWKQAAVDLSTVDLTGTTPADVAQGLADARCDP